MVAQNSTVHKVTKTIEFIFFSFYFLLFFLFYTKKSSFHREKWKKIQLAFLSLVIYRYFHIEQNMEENTDFQGSIWVIIYTYNH